jgi:hypothetical protein
MVCVGWRLAGLIIVRNVLEVLNLRNPIILKVIFTARLRKYFLDASNVASTVEGLVVEVSQPLVARRRPGEGCARRSVGAAERSGRATALRGAGSSGRCAVGAQLRVAGGWGGGRTIGGAVVRPRGRILAAASPVALYVEQKMGMTSGSSCAPHAVPERTNAARNTGRVTSRGRERLWCITPERGEAGVVVCITPERGGARGKRSRQASGGAGAVGRGAAGGARAPRGIEMNVLRRRIGGEKGGIAALRGSGALASGVSGGAHVHLRQSG